MASYICHSMNDFPVIETHVFAKDFGIARGQTLLVARKKCMALSCFFVKSSGFGQRVTHFRRDFVRSGGD